MVLTLLIKNKENIAAEEMTNLRKMNIRYTKSKPTGVFLFKL